jgi:hypothetical protein
MSATVVSYTSGTNTLVVNVNDVRGSGTYAVWSINLDGATGVQGTTGAQGTVGSQGTTGAQGTEGAQGISGQLGTYAETITPSIPYTATSFNITHGLGTTDVSVTVYDTFTIGLGAGAEVVTDVTVSGSVATIGFAVAPQSGETYRVVVKA